MIEQWVENWHAQLRGEYPGGLDALLADDVVFYSPIVFSPQKGKDLAKLYLTAAGATFGGESSGGGADAKGPRMAVGESFRYAKQVLHDHHAVLEFEVEVEGKFVNGVDIITFDDDGRIVEFKVMLRPLQAIQLMHRKMAAMLEAMKGRASA